MSPLRETRRLKLSEPVSADIADLFRFFGDRRAMHLTQSFEDIEQCAIHVLTHEKQREINGCAPWVVSERATGSIVGWGGLYEDPFDIGWGIELAYRFAPTSWGKGYATELAMACISVARDELHLDKIIAFSHPDNAASQNVLRKAGFERQKFLPEMNRYLFKARLA
jgi:[ribosomal protein S5]-alanine N-acetyltransferase